MTRRPRCWQPWVNSTKSPSAVSRIDPVIVRDIVAVVSAGRRLERHQPDRGDAEPMQIIQTAQQPFEVADAVGIGVHVGADRQTIEDAILVPKVVDHPQAAFFTPLVFSGPLISGKGFQGSR
jgi:hypothetical protein